MLLEDPENRGCPFEYLLARIRSRRNPQGTSIEGFTEGFEAAQEMTAVSQPTGPEAVRYWLWHQMEPKIRTIHAPLFFYYELKPLVQALRRREARCWDECGQIMATSLFPGQLKSMVVDEAKTTEETLNGISRLLRKGSKEFDSLQGAYQAGGIRAFETLLLGATLAYASETELHPALRTFFNRLSDMLNLMTLSRQLRWHSATVPPLVPGGRIGKTTMETWLAAEGQDGRDAFTASLTGGKSFPIIPTDLERELLGGMTRLCRRLARETDGVGLVVDYLWGLSMEARHQGLSADRRGLGHSLRQEEMAS